MCAILWPTWWSCQSQITVAASKKTCQFQWEEWTTSWQSRLHPKLEAFAVLIFDSQLYPTNGSVKPASANHALSNQNFEILSGMFPMRSFHARPWTTEKSTYSCSVGQLTTCRVRLESSKSKKTGGRLQKQTRWYIDNYREWFQCVSTTGLFYTKAILFVQIPVLAYSTEGDFSKASI